MLLGIKTMLKSSRLSRKIFYLSKHIKVFKMFQKPAIIFILFKFSCIKVACVQDITRPLPPHQPYYQGIQYFSDVSPISCSGMQTASFHNRNARNGMIDTKYRWTTFSLYLDDTYDFQERSNINDAMWTLSQLIPCIPFGIWPQNSTPTGDYVHVIKETSNGCSSYTGRQGGRQIMNLQSPGCMHKGTITHELIHALGFHHEHGRTDRDNYIDIVWENVEPGMEHAFQKYSSDIVTSFGVPYNIQSIMHYDNKAFSKNGQSTIIAKNGNGSEIFGSLELQNTDIEKLQRMYNCTTFSEEK